LQGQKKVFNNFQKKPLGSCMVKNSKAAYVHGVEVTGSICSTTCKFSLKFDSSNSSSQQSKNLHKCFPTQRQQFEQEHYKTLPGEN
jgi:hypothetical protein